MFNKIISGLARLIKPDDDSPQRKSKHAPAPEPSQTPAEKPQAPAQDKAKHDTRQPSSPSPKPKQKIPAKSANQPQPSAAAAPKNEPQRSAPKNAKSPAAGPASLHKVKPLPESPLPKTEFANFGLAAEIVAATVDLGFSECTPVQRLTLPHSLKGSDLLAQAQTGSGKTAAFLITALQRFLKGELNNKERRPSVLVLAPTRELARQIQQDAVGLAAYTHVRTLAVYGGMKFGEQQDELTKGMDIVVATPGRLLDFMNRRVVDLSAVQLLVIDEADRMLDMGFIPDVRRIVRALPPREKRQTMMFSATLTSDVRKLADSWTVEPETVEIEPDNLIPEEVEERVYSVAARDKLALLLHTLNTEESERVLVFCNRRDSCDRVHRQLLKYGVNSALLTGDVPQKKRESVLEAFREARIRVIVATDVAGRGIHVSNITHVVNYDLPYDAEDYVHRIGRTGRAGVKGVALSFACEEGGFVIPDIEEYIKRELPTQSPEPDWLKLPHPQPGIAGRQQSEDPGPRKNRPDNRRRRRNPHRR